MVLTKPELMSALAHESKIVLHLAGKVDRSQLDYRPTPKQRSTMDMLRYLSMMGPEIVRYSFSPNPGFDDWTKAVEATAKLDFDGVVKQIAALPATYEKMLGAATDADFRAVIKDFEGQPTSRGAFLVELVLGGHAAYRTQLFLYLKSCGQEQLDSSDLWNGVDGKK
ncbi:MAG: hypothetical protein JNL44_13745 [Gemmatimonadetes bacterium]|nr:hypothetical protein [Gemmatimonadota bacterium]